MVTKPMSQVDGGLVLPIPRRQCDLHQDDRSASLCHRSGGPRYSATPFASVNIRPVILVVSGALGARAEALAQRRLPGPLTIRRAGDAS